MFQADSIAIGQETPVEEIVMRPKTEKMRHPYEVLRSLPRDATPAQQDSAIQAVFHPQPIKYSDCPDTLHLPGHGIGKNLKDVNLPQYYRENFFSADSMYHPEINGGQYGMAGDPVPYTVRNDNVISTLLIACFVLSVVAIAKSGKYLLYQTKNFFRTVNLESNYLNETSVEVHFQLVFLLQECLLLSVLQYFYTQEYISSTFILSSQYLLIAIYFGVVVGYHLLHAVVYTMVNAVFFDLKKNIQWMQDSMYLSSLLGLLIFPAVMLLVYFNVSLLNTFVYFIVSLIFVKILAFYKCYIIFFRQKGGFLHLFLYFCALEMVPLLALFGILVLIGNYLKINF